MQQVFAGGAKQTQITGALTSGATTFTVDDATGYPTSSTVPHVVAVDLGLSSEEKMLVTRVGNTFTVTTRGYDGTAAQAHAAGATIDHVLDSVTLQRLNDFLVRTYETTGRRLIGSYENSTSAATGTSGATLPAQPQGFIHFWDANNARVMKVPYYLP